MSEYLNDKAAERAELGLVGTAKESSPEWLARRLERSFPGLIVTVSKPDKTSSDQVLKFEDPGSGYKFKSYIAVVNGEYVFIHKRPSGVKDRSLRFWASDILSEAQKWAVNHHKVTYYETVRNNKL